MSGFNRDRCKTYSANPAKANCNVNILRNVQYSVADGNVVMAHSLSIVRGTIDVCTSLKTSRRTL